jgi:HK97 family phage major capsid protein
MSAITLSDIDGKLLPSEVVDPIFNRVIEESVITRLARRVQLSETAATSIPVAMDVPLADWVGEGESKPIGSSGVNVKQMQGKKVACIVPVSDEVARNNPAGLYAQLLQDLPVAIARAFDYAGIHGKKIVDDTAGPFTGLISTPHEINLGTASQATGGVWKDIIDGEALVVNDGWDLTGFAADPRLKPRLKVATDSTG